MRRALLFFLSLLVSLPAAADMFQDARNATLPAAMTNLVQGGINLTPVTVKPALTQSPGSMVLTGGGWAINNWWGAVAGAAGGQNAQWLFGSLAAPITTAGSPVAIGIVQGKTAATCGNNSANTGCNSALLVQNIGTSASTMVTSGITAYAETQSTAGGGTANSQAINAIAATSPTAQTHAMGAYIVGIRGSTVGLSGARGMELSVWNNTAVDCDGVGGGGFVPQCVGLSLGLRGNAMNSTAMFIGVATPSAIAREGFTVGTGTIAEKTFNDMSSSTISLNIAGTHDVALKTSPTAGKVLIGTDASYAGPGGFEHAFQYYARLSSGAGTQFGLHTNDANGTRLAFSKSRHPTVGSHTAVQDGDNLGQLIWSGSDGTSYGISAQIITKVSGAVSAGIVPTRMAFFTTNSSGVGVEAMFLSPSGDIGVVGAITAPALATAGTIAGSLCRTAAGSIIYKAGANCF